MNLTFSQSQGTITQDDGTLVTDQAFAGNDSRPGVNPTHIQGRNNPDAQGIHKIGPLPQGVYTLGAWEEHPRLGPICSPLTQISGETFGRDAFYIHGPSSLDYANSSEGCIVVPHVPREAIMNLAPDTITVVA